MSNLVPFPGPASPAPRDSLGVRAARIAAHTLNSEESRELRITEQPPGWSTKPEYLGRPLPDRGGMSNGAIFLPLYLDMNLGNQCINGKYTPTIEENPDGTVRLIGGDLEDFNRYRQRMVAFGMIETQEDACLVINQYKGRSRDYCASLAVETSRLSLARLIDLRKHFAAATESIRLLDFIFGLDGASADIVPPEKREDRMAIHYSGLSVKEFAQIVGNRPFVDLAEATIEAQFDKAVKPDRGFGGYLGALMGDRVPKSEQAEMILDAENPDLRAKLLRLAVAKNFLELEALSPGESSALLERLRAGKPGLTP